MKPSNPVNPLFGAIIRILALLACVLSQGCGTIALHNLQVAEQCEYEREMEARGLVPLRKSSADIWAETWWWKVPLGIIEGAGTAYAIHETIKDRGGDDLRSYHETNNYPPPEDAAEEDATAEE